jgi:hypothetical protein
MSDGGILLPAGVVRLGRERPVRMAAVTPKIGVAREPILMSSPPHGSAVAAYVAPISYSWRDTPLDGVKPKRR